MGLRAKLYIGAVVSAGAAVAIFSLFTSTWPNGLRFAVLALIGALAAGLKVKLPGITGTMSVSNVFILSAILDLSLAETVVIALLSAFVQCVWHAKERPKLVPILFNCSSMALAAVVAYGAFHALPNNAFLMIRLALAAGAYFLVNTGSIAGVVAVTESSSMFAIWRNSYAWSFPYYFVGASIAAVGAHLTEYVGWETSLIVVPVVFIVYRSYGLYLKQLAREKEHAESLAALHLRTIEALALAIEAKDQTTGEHLKRVQVYAREIAAELGIGDDETSALQAASILHDIGKLAVPDYIISKPGKLTPEEFEKMKIHPVVGAEILQRINFPYPVVPIVRAHHEKWDGSGYPYGLRAEEIPIGARILSAVDCFDALASDRQYRKALPLDEALAIVIKESGRAFDPAVVGVLQRRYLELEKLACAEPAIEELKLSIDLVVERGNAPDAGYEEAAARPIVSGQPQLGSQVSPAAARHQIQALYEFILECDAVLDTGETLSLIAARLRTIVSYDAVVIYINEGKTLVPIYVAGENQKVFSALRIRVGQGVSGWVQENHKPILNGNPSVEPGYLNDPAGSVNLESVLAVPLDGFSKDLGVLALYRTGKAAFSHDQLRSLQTINSKLSRAIEISLPRRKSAALPGLDALTGLPNALALFHRLEAEVERCARDRSPLSLLICDLDGFRYVNTHFGSDTGDRLLHSIGSILQQRFAGQGFVARTGGDEFALVLPGIDEAGLASKVTEIEHLIAVRGAHPCPPGLSVSVGAAVYGASEFSAERLLNAADGKLYEAKSRRRQPAPDYSGLLTLSKSVAAGLDRASQPAEADAVRQGAPKG